jgi:hypothetical protein
MDTDPSARHPSSPASVPSIASGVPLHGDVSSAFAVLRCIRDEFIRTTPHLEPGSVLGATGYDLVKLFALYDEHSFRGHFARRFAEQGCGAPQLMFSGRLTASAGRTVKLTWREPTAPDAPPRTAYRIEVSVPLVLESFREGAREVHVGGIVCKDRLDVVQRIVEHELVHLLELLAWDTSDCSGPNFLWFASRLFGHAVPGHGLMTRREQACASGLHAGDRVAFEHDGVRRVGRIDSIRRRATVLVEEPCPGSGAPHVRKFYVPLGMLQRERGA